MIGYKKMEETIVTEKILVYRAGLVPYVVEHGQIYMMFMSPSDIQFAGSEHQIAKGRVEPEDVDHRAAALREAKEELGLFEGNIIRLDEVGVFMGRTTLFTAKVKSRKMFGEPSSETATVAWMTPEEFDMEGRILHRPVVKSLVRFIKQIENIS